MSFPAIQQKIPSLKGFFDSNYSKKSNQLIYHMYLFRYPGLASINR